MVASGTYGSRRIPTRNRSILFVTQLTVMAVSFLMLSLPSNTRIFTWRRQTTMSTSTTSLHHTLCSLHWHPQSPTAILAMPMTRPCKMCGYFIWHAFIFNHISLLGVVVIIVVVIVAIVAITIVVVRRRHSRSGHGSHCPALWMGRLAHEAGPWLAAITLKGAFVRILGPW